MEFPPEATFCVRFSLTLPREGLRDQVIALHRRLVEGLPAMPGFVRGYLIVDGDPLGRVGHLNVYRTEDDAERAAHTEHVLSLRSELMLLVDEASHAEHSYTAVDPQLLKGSA